MSPVKSIFPDIQQQQEQEEDPVTYKSTYSGNTLDVHKKLSRSD